MMKRNNGIMIMAIAIIAFYLSAVPVFADEVAISGLSLSQTGHLQINEPITVTANAEASDGQIIYYKFYYCANYGTDDYDTSPWTVVQDYSTTNSAVYTFPSVGNYIIVVRAVTDPDNEPEALPIIGQAVVVGDDSQVSLVGMIADATTETNAGDTVIVTATASGPDGQSLYYEFYYCANYGTSSYDTTPWTLVQEYSTSNSCRYVFPSDGNYIVVVRAVTDPNNEPTALPIVGSAVSIGNPTTLLQASDFYYLGSFRLPGSEERPRTFEYGGNAMTFNSAGDPSGPLDGFPGSLFIMGHDRMSYGYLPNGNQVAEIDIPVPVDSPNIEELNYGIFLQNFHDVAAGSFTTLDEIPRVGLEYLDHSATGPKIHICWGAHFQDPPADVASHGWFDPDLSTPDMQGTWYIGNQNLYSVNGYLFEIPPTWADQNVSGRYLGTGRFRDGGMSGMGPALFAYMPWIDSIGTPAANGSRLDETPLLLYANAETTIDVTTNVMSGYQHPDEWEGGAWVTTSTGKTAVLFAGTKGEGSKYWYGYMNAAGPDYPCVDAEVSLDDTLTCRMNDGSSCPDEDFTGCCVEGVDCLTSRGWWSSEFSAWFLLYDPADLAQVANGTLQSWEPQSYVHLDIDEHLFHDPAGVDSYDSGTGVQRRYRIGAMAYDRINDLIYVLERFADNAKPVIHVWRLRAGGQQ